MSIASEITRINTNIANSYTAVDNKGGTLPATQNSANLASAIDSIEVIEQATAEAESLSLANTKAMPYSDYVVKGKSEQEGTPSPSNPSEIHSVADDVNLLNLENIENHSVNSYYYENIGTNFQLKAGETYTLSFDAESDITPFDVGIGCGSSGNYQSDILDKNGFQNGRISITFTPQNSNFTYGNYLALRFVKYNSPTSYTYSARNIKLQKGTTATPNGVGTVTIKQRGTTENNDYTFQIEPLRSLPNGVKDTIEVDGIHRRVGRYILPEIASLSSGTALGTQCQYASTYSLPNSKTGGRNYNFISNIIAPANEIYGQYKGYKNSTNFVIMTSTDDTVENFNSKISGAEVLYELAEEIIEPLTQNQATTMLDIIKTGSYEGTTNIYTDEDVKPTIGVDYYKKA